MYLNAIARHVLVPKLIILLLVVSCLCAQAKTNAQQISLTFKNAPLKKVLKEIQLQSGYNIIYNDSILSGKKKIDIDVQNAGVKEVLAKCFPDKLVGCEIIDRTIILNLKASPAPTGNSREEKPRSIINGTIKDTSGAPLAGASVFIKRSSKGTVTNGAGNFSIDAAAGDILVISSVGYVSKEIKIANTGDHISIVLEAKPKEEAQVVVTALGITRDERKLGYATTTVNGKLLNEAKEANVASSLEGRVAGLNINTVNGGPGSSARILIRGISNFSSGNVGPLFVIDGVPMNNTQQGTPGTYGGSDQGDGISSINPDDIESMTVLKGSTASALYGALSSNGVILITTKSGKNTRGIGVEVSSNFYLNHAVNLTDFQKEYGAGQHGVIPQTVSDLINNDGFNSWGEKFAGQQAIGFDGKMHPYAPVSNPWDQFYRDAPVITNTVSLSHGGKDGNMRLSLSQTDIASIMPNSNSKRYSGNLNINQNITDKLKLSTMANFLHENVKNRPYLNDFTRNANFTMTFLPSNISPNDLKPGWDPVTGKELLIDATGYYENPWFAVYKLVNNTSRNRFITSTSLRYDLAKGLYTQARVGLDYIVDNTLQYESTGWGENTNGKLDNQGKQETTELNLDALVGYSHDFTRQLGINVTAGGNIRKNQVENIGYYNQNWVEPFVYTVANSNGLAANYLYSKLRTNSLYYSVDLNCSRYLTVSTTGRSDWYSTVVDNPIFTPSASASFLFGNLLDLPKMNFGKLRASYAQTSSASVPYRTQVTYQPQGAITLNGNTAAYGFPQSFVFDPNEIRAYKMKEYEFGIETRFLNSRIGMDVTYFSRKTTKELVNEPIDPAAGFSSAYLPLGETSNKGVELRLTGAPVVSASFSWNIDFNFTYVANKLVSLGDSTGAFLPLNQYTPATGGTTNAGDGSFIAHVQGLPLSQIMVYDYKRDKSGNIVVSNGVPVKGNLIAAGSGIPKIYGGINNSFTCKRFSFDFLVDYRFKVKVLSGTNFESLYYGTNKSTLAGRVGGIVFKGVNEDGTPNTTNVDAQTFYQGQLNNGIATMEVFDASFIKLRQVTLGYDIPLSKATKNTIQSVKVSLVGRNLWTIVKHTPNFDPESQYSSTLENAGLEGGSLPPTRSYGVNLNVRF